MQAAQKVVQRVTFPAFIFQTLASTDASSAPLLTFCATIAGTAILAHLIVCSIIARCELSPQLCCCASENR